MKSGKIFRIVLAIGLMWALMLALTGCSFGASLGSGGKIIYPLIDDPEQMNPTLNTYSRSSFVLQQLFRGLYKFDRTNSLVPALAEGHTVDESGAIYTFKLRGGLKWSDGSPLTAHDFEFAWKHLLDPKTVSGAVSDMYVIKNAREYNEGKAAAADVGVKATDDLTLQVTLNGVTPWFIAQTATTTYMPVSKAAVEKYGLDWAKSAEHYVSSGVFMLKSMNSKDKISMVKNPNYYAADEVKIDEVHFVIIPDEETQFIAFENGELSLTNQSLTPQMREKYAGPQLSGWPRIGVRFIDFNTVAAPFDDPRVRRALAISINRQNLMDNIVRTNEKVLYGFTPYGQPSLSDPSKEFRDVCGDVYKEDVDAAKKLLADAGYPDGKDFPTFRLASQTNQVIKDIAQTLQHMWKESLNIDCEIVTYEKGYWDELAAGNFEVAISGWTGDYPDPDTNLKIWAIGGNDIECAWNQPRADGTYQETLLPYDAIIEATRKTADQAERERLFIEAEKYLAEMMPSAPLFSYMDFIITQANLHGVQKNYIGHINFEYAYFD
ncbi:MAG: peptide ABC transporter substrate-binding protein [Synergistaceae bacterium]|jgi:oligopeptide transport system substrate-binding protein|nr:peptide ABC transporter substrate-binding protein [Synergistaceae bacterium]